MRRIFGYLLFAILVVLGLFFGQRNADRVTLDLYYVTLNMPLAVAVIGSVVAGVLLGSFTVYLSVVLKQKVRIRQLTRQLSRMPTARSGDGPAESGEPAAPDPPPDTSA